MADASLEMVVKLVDEASANINTIKKNITGMSDETTAAGQSMTSKLGGVSAVATKLGTAFTVAGAAISTALGFAVNSASDLNESINAVNVVFTTASDRVLEFGTTAAESAGLSQRAFYEAVTPIGAMLQNMGQNANLAATSSIELAKRGADLASVFNTDLDSALTAISAALRGEADPIERFGVSMNETAVKAYALREGLISSGEEMDAQTKIAARLGAFFEQTRKIAGDFSNTSDGLANRSRILKAQLEELGASVGTILLPNIERIVNAISPIVGKIREWAEANPKLFTAIVLVVGAIGTALTVIGPLVIAFGLFASLATTVGVAMLPLFGIIAGVTLGIAALGAGIVAIVAYWPQIKTFFSGAIGYFKLLISDGDILNDNIQVFPKFFQDAMLKLRDVIKAVSEWFSEMKNSVITRVTETRDGIVNKFNELYNGVANAMQSVLDAIMGVWDAVKSKTSEIWNGIVDAVAIAMEAVSGAVVYAWDGIVAGVTAALDMLSSIVTSIWDGIMTVLSFAAAFAVGAIVLIFQAMGIDIVAVFTAARDGIIMIWTTFKNTLIEASVSMVSNMLTIFKGMFDGLMIVINAFAAFWMFIWQQISDFVKSMVDSIGLILMALSALWQFVWNEIVAFAVWAWESISGVVAEKATQINDTVTGVLGMVSAVWTSVWGSIASFAKSVWESIKTTVSAGISALWAVLSPAITAMKTAFTGLWDSFTSSAASAWASAKTMLTDSINWMINKINKLISGINAIATKGASVLGITPISIPSIPGLAKGGTVTGAGDVLVGERGPERLSLPRGASVTPLDKGGSGLTIVVNNPTIMSDNDVEKFGDRLVQILKQHAAII